jgi:deazaflavin-dependent oxidoreductase (nitroreductase family)
MGKRFLMIEHRGRRSGKLYRTVIEVAGRHRDEEEWIVTAGFGPKSDWYLNLQAGTLEAVWIGSRRHAANVRFLEPIEAGDVMGAYEQAHPRTARNLLDLMGVSYDGTDEGRVEMMRQIPMVAFRLDEFG